MMTIKIAPAALYRLRKHIPDLYHVECSLFYNFYPNEDCTDPEEHLLVCGTHTLEYPSNNEAELMEAIEQWTERLIEYRFAGASDYNKKHGTVRYTVHTLNIRSCFEEWQE